MSDVRGHREGQSQVAVAKRLDHIIKCPHCGEWNRSGYFEGEVPSKVCGRCRRPMAGSLPETRPPPRIVKQPLDWSVLVRQFSRARDTLRWLARKPVMFVRERTGL